MTLKITPHSNLGKCLSLSLIFLLSVSDQLSAQVISDDSTNTRVLSENNRDFIVDQGAQQGANLFHSLQELSIPTNGSLTFDNGITIQNIITRITGSEISNIDGLIMSNGSASLFLLNPNGIVWGENARLDIGGSLISTTAESLFFADGTVFGTNLAPSPPLLTVSVPTGLQYGNNPGSIVNRANFSVPSEVLGEVKLGLTSTPGNTLALLGGEIEFAGGAIATGGGDLELGSVGANSFIILEPNAQGWDINYDQVTQFGDIQLNNLASADATGGGNVQVVGRSLEILDGSAISSNAVGNADAGTIQIQIVEDIRLQGSAPNGARIDPINAGADIFLPFASQIASDTLGSGNGGNVEIAAQSLSVEDGAGISLKILPGSTGDGGNLNLDIAGPVSLSGVRPLLGLGEGVSDLIIPQFSLDSSIQFGQASEISTANIGAGTAGDINIQANSLRLADAATIASIPIAQGDGGNINLDVAGKIELLGTSELTPAAGSTIAVTTFGAGDAGNIQINAERLRLTDGGLVISSTVGTPGAEGVGDDRNNANSLEVGKAGDIEINTERTEIVGFRRQEQTPSQIGAQSLGGGAGGNVFLNTAELVISDSGILSVEGFGQGQAGNLFVNADSVAINNGASIIATTEFQTGGNIQLDVADNLIFNSNGTISAQAFDNAQGGNVSIDANFVIAFPQQNNDILATAVAGQGGNIDVNAQGIFGLEERSSRPANQTNDIDASSEFGGPGLVSLNFPNFSATDGLFELPLDFIDVNYLFRNNFCRVSQDSKFVITGRNGVPLAPEDILLPNHTWTDWRIEPSSDELGGEIAPPQGVQQQSPARQKISPIQGWVTDAQGNVVLTAQPLVAASTPNLPTPSCNQVNNHNHRVN